MDDSTIAFEAKRKRAAQWAHWTKLAETTRVREAAPRNAEPGRKTSREVRRRGAAKLRAKFDALKQGPCADCGGTFDPFVMDLDHRDGETKLFAISLAYNMNLPWERVLAERAKCDLVCANCHRMRTLRRNEAKRLPVPPPPDPSKCGRGLHDRTPENTNIRRSGRRECGPCAAYAELRRAEKRRAAGVPRGPETHCLHGHPLTPENTYVRPDMVKVCRACARASGQRYKARRAAAAGQITLSLAEQ